LPAFFTHSYFSFFSMFLLKSIKMICNRSRLSVYRSRFFRGSHNFPLSSAIPGELATGRLSIREVIWPNK